MSTKKKIGKKLLLVSTICVITIPSVSYAEEGILSKNSVGSSGLFEGGNKDVLKSSLYPNTYNNPFNHQFKSTLKEKKTNIKKMTILSMKILVYLLLFHLYVPCTVKIINLHFI